MRILNLLKNTTNSDSPYAELAISPIQVAEVVLKAITSEKANTRYLVVNDAAIIMDKKRSSSDIELQQCIKESLIQQKGFFKGRG